MTVLNFNIKYLFRMTNRLKYTLLVVAAMLFVGFISCSSDDNADDFEIPPHVEDTGKPEGALRLMVYNVAVFNNDPNDPLNYQTIANMVKEKDADLVCLNELDSLTTRTAKDYQLEKFANIIGNWDFHYASAMPHRGGSYGEGIATKEKAIKKFSVPLPKGVGAEPRVFVVMEMEDYVIATTHLDHAVPEAQADQVRIINETIEELYGNSNKPVFLGGDLNARPGSETINTFEKNWTFLSSPQYTFPSHKPDRTLDYILQYNNGVKVELLHSEVVKFFKSGDPKVASDHLPVIVDVRILGK